MSCNVTKGLSTRTSVVINLLEQVRRAHQEAGSGDDHNVIITVDWICLIPRRHNGLERGASANASAVLGLVWVMSEEERNVWSSTGPIEHLKYVGIPR
jgi:ATP adenylyltransferase/5',5'''-P-1,P-4-tetraphosphate phosphorylase II